VLDTAKRKTSHKPFSRTDGIVCRIFSFIPLFTVQSARSFSPFWHFDLANTL